LSPDAASPKAERVGLEAVVLDLDDTLIASARAAQRARRQLLDFGVSPRRFLAADRRWWQRYLQGEVTLEQLREGRWRDLGLDPVTAAKADDAYRTTARIVNVRTGARALLRRLRALGLRIAILTNGAVEPQWRKIDKVGLGDLVDAVVITEAIGFHKPDERAFLAALERVETGASAAAMVGDTLENDVAGALATGFKKIIWLTRNGHHPDPRVVPVKRLEAVVPALLAQT
jgi:putative hydrolase of the HAD superfamily